MLDVRKALRLGLLIIGLLMAACGSAGAKGRAHVASGSPALFNREDYATLGAGTARAEAHRYSVMVLYSDEAQFVPALHRAHPSMLVLMYQFPGYANVTDPHGGMGCTSVPQDLAHPGWIARTRLGVPLMSGQNYITDIGNGDFQRACLGHAIALAKQGGFDGLFFDGANSKLSYELYGAAGGAVQFPTDGAWQNAVSSLLSYAGQAAHANGLKMFANIGGGDPSLWRQWNGPLDGAEEESWTDGGLGVSQQAPWWAQKLGSVAWSEAHGKYVLLHSYNTSEAANTFGIASMLLVANGHVSYSTSNGNVLGYEKWYPEYTTAQRLGRPLGRYRVRRNGVYERVFAHGIVLVNPSLHGVGRFSIHGRYSGSHLRRVRAVALGPLSGLILTRG